VLLVRSHGGHCNIHSHTMSHCGGALCTLFETCCGCCHAWSRWSSSRCKERPLQGLQLKRCPQGKVLAQRCFPVHSTIRLPQCTVVEVLGGAGRRSQSLCWSNVPTTVWMHIYFSQHNNSNSRKAQADLHGTAPRSRSGAAS